MDGLFSPARSVSQRRNGAVPVSVTLHAIAIGAAVLASAAVRPEAPPPAAKPPMPYLPTAVVRVSPVPPAPPKGVAPRAAVPRKHAGVPAPAVVAPPPTMAAPSEVVSLEKLTDSDSPAEFGSGRAGVETHTPCVGATCGSGPGEDPTATGSGGPVRVSAMQAPARRHLVSPVYPAPARAARVTGAVVVDCVIGPDGRVHDARVLSGHVLLREAALDAVRQWRYSPPRLNDAPVSVLLSVTVNFVLN